MEATTNLLERKRQFRVYLEQKREGKNLLLKMSLSLNIPKPMTFNKIDNRHKNRKRNFLRWNSGFRAIWKILKSKDVCDVQRNK